METDKDRIRAHALAAGFTIKPGLTDLKPYVYEFAARLLADSPLAAPTAAQRLAQFREWQETTGALPRGSSWIGELEAIVTGRGERAATAPVSAAPAAGDTSLLLKAARASGLYGAMYPMREHDITPLLSAFVAKLATLPPSAGAPADNFQRAAEITDTWPDWKQNYALTKHSAAGAPVSAVEQATTSEKPGRAVMVAAHAAFGEALPPLSLTSLGHAHVYRALEAAVGEAIRLHAAFASARAAAPAAVQELPALEAIVAAVHAASASGRVALTVTGADGIERPTNVAECFVRALAVRQPQSAAPLLSTDEQAQHAIQVCNALADTVGDDTQHPLYPMMDALMGAISAWEAKQAAK